MLNRWMDIAGSEDDLHIHGLLFSFSPFHYPCIILRISPASAALPNPFNTIRYTIPYFIAINLVLLVY